MRVEYDDVGDILFLDTTVPNEAQISDEVAEGVILRYHPATHAIETTEIHGLVARAQQKKLPLEVPGPGACKAISVAFDLAARLLVLEAKSVAGRRVSRTLALDDLLAAGEQGIGVDLSITQGRRSAIA